MFRTFAFVSLGVLFALPVQAEEVLYKLGGKKFHASDLSPAAQGNLHEVELQRYRQIKAAVESEILDEYFAEQAKKQKKSKEEVEIAELKIKDASDAEVKKFYDSNKDKIPPNYTYEQVKPEIQRILSGQATAEKRQKLIDKVMKDKKFEFALTEPQSPLVEIKVDGFPAKGKTGAKVRIVEFADFQCPHCRQASESFKKLMKNYSDRVELVFIDFPINRSGISRAVAEGAYCAKKQDKYWEYHEMAFEKQSSLTKDSPEQFAKTLNLKGDDFKKCLGSAEAKTFVSSGKDEGDRVGVGGTPTIFINGRKHAGNHDYDTLKATVDKML